MSLGGGFNPVRLDHFPKDRGKDSKIIYESTTSVFFLDHVSFFLGLSKYIF